MTQRPEEHLAPGEGVARGEEKSFAAPILAEDILLLLFQPQSGSVAGESTLFYVLAGALLADLALDERVTTTTDRLGGMKVQAVEGRSPSDELLRSAWDYVCEKPRSVQTVLAVIGPTLRQPVLERLIARGDIRERRRRALGIFPTTGLEDGGNGRRSRLLDDVRAVLVDRAEPTPRVAALAALLWGSGMLHQFGPEIPWTSSVLARAQELERGNWGAGAAAEAVTRTMNAIIAGSLIVAATTIPRS